MKSSGTRLRSGAWIVVLAIVVVQSSFLPIVAQSRDARGVGFDETTFTVTFDADAPFATQRASGFLSLINANTPDPPTSAVQPLRPRLWKNAYHTNYERITTEFECADVITTLAEHWGLPGQTSPPWLNDTNPNWTTWMTFCRQHVNTHLDQGFNPVWNVWNEPDGGNRWWHGPKGYFNLAQTYRYAYESIRQTYIDHPDFGVADLVVAAPGFADWGNAYAFHSGVNYWTGDPLEPGFDGFLQHCADSEIECHVIMWHEFWEDHVFFIPAKASILMTLVDDFMAIHPEINVQRYYVDEMIHANWPYDLDYNLSPGHVATVLSLVEIADIDGAVRAVWGDRYGFPGNINFSVCSLLDVKYCEVPPGNPALSPPPSSCHAEPYAPRSQYWVHWFYANLEGPEAIVEASYPPQAGFGTYDPTDDAYRVMLGYSLSYGIDGEGNPTYGFGTTRTRVDMSGLAIFSGTRFTSARLTVFEIPPSGLEPLLAPVTLVDGREIVYSDGTFSWTLREMKRGHAYVVQITDAAAAPRTHVVTPQ